MNIDLDQRSRDLAIKIATDVVCLLVVGFPILLFYVAGKPYERGFFCNDESIRHPYIDSTVPNWVLYIFGLGLPIACIIITEFFIFKRGNSRKERVFINRPIPSWVWESYRHIGVFGFGAACSQLTTDIAKYTIGRLRPHFYSVCQPDVNCLDPNISNLYITHFRCRGTNQKLLKDMRLSFPSGHSSFATYCMVFLVVYIQVKLKWRRSKLLKHVIQYLAIVLAIYTALSRISDYKHHWSDVLVGVLQGAIVAILIVVFVSDLYPKEVPPSRSETPEVEQSQPAVLEEKEDNQSKVV